MGMCQAGAFTMMDFVTGPHESKEQLFSGPHAAIMPGWRNWQTQRT